MLRNAFTEGSIEIHLVSLFIVIVIIMHPVSLSYVVTVANYSNFEDLGDGSGAVFGVPEAIFWYIENIGSRCKSDQNPAIIYQYELFIFHN